MMQESASVHDEHALHYAFASDNCAGLCQEAMAALQAANADYMPSYGEDHWTQRAVQLIRESLKLTAKSFLPSMEHPPIRWPSVRFASPIKASFVIVIRMCRRMNVGVLSSSRVARNY